MGGVLFWSVHASAASHLLIAVRLSSPLSLFSNNRLLFSNVGVEVVGMRLLRGEQEQQQWELKKVLSTWRKFYFVATRDFTSTKFLLFLTFSCYLFFHFVVIIVLLPQLPPPLLYGTFVVD